MNTKHTPGQWKLHDPDKQSRGFGHADKRIMVLHPDGERLIACCNTGTTNTTGAIPRDERLANARLIAAAPAMLAALSGLLRWCERECVSSARQWRAEDEEIKLARAAIESATTPEN